MTDPCKPDNKLRGYDENGDPFDGKVDDIGLHPPERVDPGKEGVPGVDEDGGIDVKPLEDISYSDQPQIEDDKKGVPLVDGEGGVEIGTMADLAELLSEEEPEPEPEPEPRPELLIEGEPEDWDEEEGQYILPDEAEVRREYYPQEDDPDEDGNLKRITFVAAGRQYIVELADEPLAEGIASPVRELEPDKREHFEEREFYSSDDLFVVKYKPIKRLEMEDDQGGEVIFKYGDPEAETDDGDDPPGWTN